MLGNGEYAKARVKMKEKETSVFFLNAFSFKLFIRAKITVQAKIQTAKIQFCRIDENRKVQ